MTGGRGVWYNSSRGRCSGAKCEGVLPPLHSPRCRRSALHPGDFLPDEKVTKESPRGVPPLGTPLGGHYHPPSNASVAPPRKRETLGSTQSTNYLPRHGLTVEGVTPGRVWGEKRPICHFEWVGKLVLFSPRVLPGKHFRMLSRGTVVAPRMLEGFICSKQYR